MKNDRTFRKKLRESQCNRCFYCGKPDPTQLDHVFPKHHGGGNSLSNLVLACISCNRIKSNYFMEEFRLRYSLYCSNLNGLIHFSKYKIAVKSGIIEPVENQRFHWEIANLSTLQDLANTDEPSSSNTERDEILELESSLGYSYFDTKNALYAYLEREGLPSIESNLLQTLFSFMWDKQSCSPPYTKLSAISGLSHTSIKKALTGLTTRGVITYIKGEHRGDNNCYTLILAMLPYEGN